MRRTILTILISYSLGSVAWAQEVWKADPANSNIQFEVEHLSISSVTGKFTDLSATMTLAKKGDFENATIEATVWVKDINTGNVTRDKHLKEDDFFNMEKYPMLKFQSTSFKRIAGNEYLLNGNLTIRDVTRNISIPVMYKGRIDLDSKSISVFEGRFSINRFDYKLTWNDTLDTGSLVVGSVVDVVINLEFVKQ